MAILVFISFAIYQAVVESYKLRVVLGDEGDFNNAIRLSMNIVQRDISMIYSPLLMAAPKATKGSGNSEAEFQQVVAQDPGLGEATRYWGAATDSTGLRPSRFVGAEGKMSFISSSHLRVYQDAPESELAKINYELQKSEREEDGDSYVLVKTESPNVYTEDDRDKMQQSYPLLYGLKSLQFAYYRKDKERWEKSWDTEKDEFKGLYPDIIRVQFEAFGPSNLSFNGNFEFRPEIPLNGIDPST